MFLIIFGVASCTIPVMMNPQPQLKESEGRQKEEEGWGERESTSDCRLLRSSSSLLTRSSRSFTSSWNASMRFSRFCTCSFVMLVLPWKQMHTLGAGKVSLTHLVIGSLDLCLQFFYAHPVFFFQLLHGAQNNVS